MAQTLTWLHLSDLHACKPRTGWDAKRVTDTLCKDLRKMQDKYGLRPDLIFFTGDAAFGHLGSSDGKSISEQFREAHDFLTTVRETFQPAIEQRNVFLVPGNHDVNRDRITDFETEWLLSNQRNLDEVTRCIQSVGANWRQLLQRLDDYAHFLQAYGYDHLLTGRDRLIYADAREFDELRVGIAGFNSAWSSRGVGREEMGRLWMAGRFQLETLLQQLPKNDFAIALLHHSTNWLVPEENPTFGRQLEREFPFVLHGHEHQDWVRADAANGHTVISTGACHEWSESERNGYNIVRLDFEQGTGEVWLRRYDAAGGGWIPRVIANRTDDRGCWNLEHLKPWMERLRRSVVATDVKPDVEVVTNTSTEIASNRKLDRAEDYEVRYCNAVAKNLDYVQLFGIDVPRESKEYSLTVAYVSLNLADEDDEAVEAEELAGDIDNLTVKTQTSLPAEQVFNDLSEKKRLLIRGVAGSGKTTLLRWAAVQAGRYKCDSKNSYEDTGEHSRRFLMPLDGVDEIQPEMQDEIIQEIRNSVDAHPVRVLLTKKSFDIGAWRQKIPFIIRLRDCSNGQLPRPNQFPLLLAKELPDPPSGWIDDVLSKGHGLIMFDGVDEVPQQARDATMREIRALINTYPDNYYVVTTRPEAVERREFVELGFVSARVEPMAPAERDEFIDSWHKAMQVRLLNWGEPTDLRPLAKRLKQRLETTPAIARLTSNPLLCAVVCALHRARNENLPETPVDLCEKLCEMLLDRRDKERLGVEAQKWIDEAYGKLEFRVRKGLLSQLAHHMVRSGLSAITEAEADQQITEALKSYQATDINATAIRRALVERSGMLQESSEQRIEFLHNTLKEFLAAERFVNCGDIQGLAGHAHDAAWQPVIFFAVALPRDGSKFATDLIQTILENTPLNAPTKARSKEARSKAAKVRAQQFFFFRCCTNAYQIDDSSITQAFKKLSKQLLPPQNMTDAVALASCGEAIIPYLKKRKGLKALERAACVRTLGLIGNTRAITLLNEYLDDSTLSVAQELVNFVDDWSKILLIRRWVEEKGFIPIQTPRKLQDISKLSNLPNLTKLDLAKTQVSDISALVSLPNLTELDLWETQVSDISALVSLPNLTKLYLGGWRVSDISALASLTNLTKLYIWGKVSDISVLANLTNLTELYLYLGESQLSDISALANLTNLTKLDLYGWQLSNISALANLTNLTRLDLGRTQVSDISALTNLTSLTQLNFFRSQVSDISPLINLINLEDLNLAGTQVSDISALANLTNLTELNLAGTQVSDISALANLTNLTELNLEATQLSDISALANLTNLTKLSVWGKVSDISALANLTNLTELDLMATQMSDISALANLTKLKELNLAGTQVSDISALANLTKLKELNLAGTQVSDISALANLTKLTKLILTGTQVSDTSLFANRATLQIFK